MHPRILDDLGLAAALEWLGRQTGDQTTIDVHVSTVEIEPALPAHVAAAVYRVAQEAIRNAVRHSQAKHLDVRLRHEGPNVVLEITDDGAGFDVQVAEARRPGMGLFSMRERMALVNGSLTVRSRPGDGATIQATVPLMQ
jgi:signal transduction histidine kinase